ncbi:Nucleoporin p58/p45 [Phytophthora nicotianae]|uniref:Nucleoporin p58/p45 n=1 Tax=Phytophthora nicotianae TaxID=4792 RepID=A0A0W8CTR3_PHYNI|nr:Nucleoporin p58/p45 [Phytophthora nicotianae]
MLPECDSILCVLSELQFLVPGRRPQESGHRSHGRLSAAQLPPMKLYDGDTIAYHTQMYVAGDPRGYRTAIVTHVDDSPGEAYTPIYVSTDEMILPTMMIKKVLNRAGEEVKCHWRKLRTYQLVSGELRAPSDRTRFAESVQNIITAAFTGAFTGASDTDPATEAEVASITTSITTPRSDGSDDDDQVPSMTSSAPITAATVVDHGFTDAHEYEEEYAYEERAPVPTPTNKIKAKTKSKKTALGKRPSTPPCHLQIPAAPPKARATPAQGHPSEEILQRTGTKIARKMAKGSVYTSSGQDVEIVSDEAGASGDLLRLNTLAFVSMKTSSSYKKKASSLNSGVKQVEDGGAEVDEKDVYLESEEKAEDNDPDPPDQPDQPEQLEQSSQPTPSQLTALHEILAVPTLAQRETQYHRRKVGKVDYHVSKSRKKRYQNRRAPTRNGTNIYHAHNLKAKTMKDLLRMPGMRAKLINVRKKKPGYIPPSQPDPNNAETGVMEPVPFPDYVTEVSENIVPEGLYFVDAGDVDPCLCVGDCSAHCCRNADTAFYCTPEICRLDALCSNAPRTHPGLRIYNTRRLGLGVYTTQKLWTGEIVAEYCGKLQEYEAMREGQLEEAMKQNSGYAMLLNEKTRRGNFVYIEALTAGSNARFFQHSCRPNVEFVEMQNRAQVKVLCRMISTVDAGAQITVSYDNDIWFRCACDQCWKEHA